jgi:hypothetical protein
VQPSVTPEATKEAGEWYEVAIAVLPKPTIMDWYGWVCGSLFAGAVGFFLGMMMTAMSYGGGFAMGWVMAGLVFVCAAPGLWWAIGLDHGPRRWGTLAKKLAWIETQLGAGTTAEYAARGEWLIDRAGAWEMLERRCGESIRPAMVDAYMHGELTAWEPVLAEANGLGDARLKLLLAALVGSNWKPETIRTKALELLGPSGLRYNIS